ncbi:MAG: MFS transporter [Anaeromyxobacteraceae bacterium]
MNAATARAERREALGLAAIVGEGLLSRLSFGVVSFALPLYARRMGVGIAEIGFLVGLNGAVAIALKPLCGWATDRFGARRSLLVAVALRSVVSLLLVFATGLGQLYAIRALHGVAMGLRDPAAAVLLAGGAEKRVASRFGWYQSAKSLGGSLGKGLAGFLIALTGSRYPAVFFGAFALSALPLAVVALYVHDPADAGAAASPADAPRPTARPAARRRVAAYAGLGLLVAATAEMLNQLFPVLATEVAGLSAAQAGAVYLGGSVLAVAAGPVFGWLSDRIGDRPVLLVRGVSNVLSSVAFLVAPNLAGVAVARVADDLGKGAFRPAWGKLMARVAKEEPSTRARTMSWLGMGEDLGELLGPLLAGALWSAFGIGVALGARIALALVSEVYAVRVAHAFDRPPAQAEAAPLAACGGDGR